MEKITDLFLKQLTKNLFSLPGWVPLVIFGYACIYAHPALSQLSRDYQTAIVIVLAYIFYQLGDAIDKAIYKKLEPKLVLKPRENARKALKIHDGIYKISKELADTCGQYTYSFTQLCNEFSKFFRSFCVATLVITIALVLVAEYYKVIIFFLTALISFFVYVYLKAIHMKSLYDNAFVYTCCSRYYFSCTLDNHIVLFFWKGELIGSGRKKLPEDTSRKAGQSNIL